MFAASIKLFVIPDAGVPGLKRYHVRQSCEKSATITKAADETIASDHVPIVDAGRLRIAKSVIGSG
jgi:hypothetical protein